MKRISLLVVITLLGSLGSFVPVEAMHSDAFTFLVPYDADDLSAQFQAAQDQPIDEDLLITISVSVLRPETTVIYYDHWEDGLEPNFATRTQPSTEVWGNGDPSDGAPQNIPGDVFSPGDDIAVQRSLVDVPIDANSTPFPYDGGDEIIAVGGSIAVTMLAWPEILPFDLPGILFAGAWELYPTSRWGTNYVIPVGENLSALRAGFTTVGLNVQAVEDDTEVVINDPISGFQETVILGRGENYAQVGIDSGTTVQATAPVQVHIFTGNPPSRYEARAYTIVPLEQWTGDYLAPRSSDGDFWLYNPNSTDLEIAVETIAGTDTVTVPANGNASYPAAVSPDATGMRFTAPDHFYGLALLDDADVQDWGYALQPVANLTSQALIGWAPGNNLEPPSGSPPPAGTTGFESRVYVTAIETSTVTVDYVGDGSRTQDFPVLPLAEVDITDPVDFDLTGARLYTDGVPFVAVWGQDQSANPGDPSIDVGTNIVPLRAPSIQKTYRLITEGYNCGPLTRPYRVRFELWVFNDSIVAIPNVIVTDNLPDGMRYIPGTTTVIGAPPIPDDSSGSPFPFDEGGYNVGTLDGGDGVFITFDVQIDVTGSFENVAQLTPPTDPAIAELSLPSLQSGYQISKNLIDPPAGLVAPGQVITFGLTITNTGAVTITQLPVWDTFDESVLTFQSATVTPDLVAPGVITWTDLTIPFGALSPNASISQTLSFSVSNPIPLDQTGTSNVVLGEGVEDSFGRSQAIVCSVAEVNFRPEPELELGCACRCEEQPNLGVEIGNLANFPVDAMTTMTIRDDGREVFSRSEDIHLEADQTVVKTYTWDQLGLVLPPNKPGNREVVLRSDNALATCGCNCEDKRECEDPPCDQQCDEPPDSSLVADCKSATVNIFNPCSDAEVDERITLTIDGEIVVDEDGNRVENVPVQVKPNQSYTRAFEWGKDGRSLIDAQVHTIELRTESSHKTVIVGPCWPDELPKTGDVRGPVPLHSPWLALP